MRLTLQLFHRQHCDNVWGELGRVWAWPIAWIAFWIAQWHYLLPITLHRLPDSAVVYPACSSFLSERDWHAVSQPWSELACVSFTATVQALTELGQRELFLLISMGKYWAESSICGLGQRELFLLISMGKYWAEYSVCGLSQRKMISAHRHGKVLGRV